MPILSLGLILFSAVIHVLIHLAFKKAQRRLAFAWWVLLLAMLIFLPLAGDLRTFPLALWAILILSGAFDALYFGTIGRAYAEADLSVVYPLARGSAPLFLTLWSAFLLRESPTWGGVLGILLIALGLYVVNLPGPDQWREPLRSLANAGPRWALLAGLCTSIYSAIDKIGVGYLPALQYTYWTLALSWIWLSPVALTYHTWGELFAEWRSSWVGILVAAVASLASYGLVLVVVRSGVPVAYTGAARETSVILGVFAGARILKEGRLKMRLLGAAGVVGGVALIALAGR